MDAPRTTKAFAKTLRRRMSLPEVLLWREIKAGQLAGLHFRKQHPIPPQHGTGASRRAICLTRFAAFLMRIGHHSACRSSCLYFAGGWTNERAPSMDAPVLGNASLLKVPRYREMVRPLWFHSNQTGASQRSAASCPIPDLSRCSN